MASYIFLGFFTKAKVGAAPASAPTVDVCNVVTNALVVTAGSATALTSMPGLYTYMYSGAAGLRLVATFKTSDATVDQQHLPSYTPTEITDYLDATISSRNAVAPPTELSIAAAVRGGTHDRTGAHRCRHIHPPGHSRLHRTYHPARNSRHRYSRARGTHRRTGAH
jgi:hypothetical protein